MYIKIIDKILAHQVWIGAPNLISGGHPNFRKLVLIPDDHTEFQRKLIKI
jgi:hypothetical protein